MRVRIGITHEFEFDVYPASPVKWPSPSDDIGHPAEPTEVNDVALVLSAVQLRRLRQASIPWTRDLTDENLSRAVQNVLAAVSDDAWPGDHDEEFMEALREHSAPDPDWERE